MTAMILNSIRVGTAKEACKARRASRQRIGASQEFRSLVAEFDARRGAGREPPASTTDGQISRAM